MSNTTYYSLSVATAIFGGFFAGAIPFEAGLGLWLLIHALLFRLNPALFVKTGGVIILFAFLLTAITNDQSVEGQTPLNRRAILLAVIVLAVAVILYGVRNIRLSNARDFTTTLSAQYQRFSKDKSMVRHTTTELGHLTASRIKSSMTLSQIERVSAEITVKHPHLDLMHVVPETNVLDAIYSKERQATFTTPLLERSNSLGKKYFGAISKLAQRLPSINLLSRHLQRSESGYIAFGTINNPIAQNIASQITTHTTIAQIEQLSQATKRPNTVWGTSNIIQRD